MLEYSDYLNILIALANLKENYEISQKTNKMYSNEFYERKIKETQCLYDKVHKAFMEY